MYSATFIFAKKQFDDAFHRLDRIIADAAKSLPGYLGEETWENTGNGLVSNVYYGLARESAGTDGAPRASRSEGRAG